MKKLIQYLSCLLSLLLVLTSATSCSFWKRVMEILNESETKEEESEEPKSYAAFGREYNLTDEDKAEFLRALQEALQLMEEGAEESVIDEKIYQIEDLFYHISDQADLAYVFFCMDGEDLVASDQYTYASEMKSDAYYEYMVMCQTVDASDYPYRAHFFEDWTESDFVEMRQYTEEISAINKKNDELLVEYRALDPDADSFGAEVSRLYVEMVANNQALATKFGYPDYVSYAHEMVYERDYSHEELVLLRSYMQNYLVPLCESAFDAFYESYQELTPMDQLLISGWLYNDYDDVAGDPVEAYVASLPESMQACMSKVLQEEYAIFTEELTSYEGAFTGYFYEDSYPFCYFGPGYHSVFTVIHEAGHFWAADCQGGLDIDLDLAELHSQGNEWLMLEFSKGMLSRNCYQALRNYKLYESLATVIVGVIIDEFEEMVYTNASSLDGSLEQLEGYINEICNRYGGKDFIEEYITDISTYWKFVVIESPVYYISYSVSAISALALYSEATKNYAKAFDIYEALSAGELIPDAFLENLKKAGLATPFDESVYIAISQLIK